MTRKSDDEACGRLLEVYVQEAERYDKGLVQSWKDDMDVTLVFSGLYSAVLTAFVIESYQKLQEDPADASVALLRRISGQLIYLSNSSNIIQDVVNEVPQDEFTPTPAAVACNVLWFSSLILAICCAFLATFVQQWSRQFIHKTGRLNSSRAHARLLSFLYFGLKNFRMHTVVNVIPSMLHLSLFLFLGGLIAFLRDVNPVLTYIVAAALTIVTVIYFSFTVWPLVSLDSPYQTPLSPIVWKIWQVFAHYTFPIGKNVLEKTKYLVPRAIIQASHLTIIPILPTASFPHQPPLEGVLVETSPRTENLRHLFEEVMAASQKCDPQRDVQCITWTLSLLTDDQELLPFIEALPDVIFGPNGVHDNNLHLIKSLLETTDPEADIILRITSLMTNASNSWFNEKHRVRCFTACPKALWGLAFMLAERQSLFDLTKTSRANWFPVHVLHALRDGSPVRSGRILHRPYAPSAFALCAIYSRIDDRDLGCAVSLFLQASKGEFEPFEFRRTSLVIERALPGYLSSDRFRSGLKDTLEAGDSAVPWVELDRAPHQEQIARFDAVVGLCLQIRELPYRDIKLALGFISKRAELDRWGSTQRIWERCTTLSTNTLKECATDRRLCNALRECIYAHLPSHATSTIYCTRDIDNFWVTCARILSRRVYVRTGGLERPVRPKDDDKDTSQFALETMIAMRVILIDSTDSTVDLFEDFEFVRRYVQQNVLRLGDKSWLWDDPFYGEDVKTSRVIILKIRLLQHFLLSADNPNTARDILDALEFTLFITCKHELFDLLNPASGSRVISEELAVIFSKTTLDISRWWMKKPYESLPPNALEILTWVWFVWGGLKAPQSEQTSQNLEEAAKLVLSSESMQKVKGMKTKTPARKPGRCPIIHEDFDWTDNSRFNDVRPILRNYSDRSMHSQTSGSISGAGKYGDTIAPRIGRGTRRGSGDDHDGNSGLPQPPKVRFRSP